MLPLLLTLTVSAPPPPTFAADVAPILHARCAACHHEGDVGPFPLLSYADAKKRAKLIAGVTAEKTMPPWKPDAGHGDFRDNKSLSEKQIATLAAWADAGAPEGDAAKTPPPPKFSKDWQLGTPDLVLTMPEAFAVPAEGRDIYMHFVFPLDLKREVYLKGVECRPGNRKVAHHAVGILDASGTARKLDAAHPGPGYPGAGPGFLPAGFTPGYAPGARSRFFYPDTAITLKPGTDFVLQMHYHPVGKVETDRTEVGLYFTKKKPEKGMLVVAMASEEIDIPAGLKNYTAKDRFTLPVDLEIRDIWAHMHMAGKSVTVTADLPGGETRKMLKISDWDFNWQDSYSYKKVHHLPKGTVIKAEWTWDNSADNPRNPFSPPRRIRLGEGSTDEMSGLILGGVAKNGWDELSHWGGVLAHYLEISAKGWKYKR